MGKHLDVCAVEWDLEKGKGKGGGHEAIKVGRE